LEQRADFSIFEGDVPQLSVGERQRILFEFNATHAGYPQQLIHGFFEEQVRRNPLAIAVQHNGVSLTYGQLNQKANQLASYLRTLGVAPETMVAVCVERSLDMIVSLLGILKAGGAYIPLDPSYPTDRLQLMLEDTRPQVLLTQQSRQTRLPDVGAHVVSIDADWRLIDQQPAGNLSGFGLRPDHLAYVIYTSGSTGRPKGVLIEHRNASNLISWARSVSGGDVFEQTLMCTSLNFDLSVYECFVPLSVGGTLQIVDNALSLIGNPLDVTLINTVPSAMKALLDAQAVPGSTRTVNLAGEPLPESLVRRIIAGTAVERVNNLYGPTETTTYSSWISMPRAGGFRPTIGHPIANTQFFILNPRLEPVPVGVVGEIYIGGTGVTRG